ncbi:MAG TPA: TCR/Tet family MFS transporter [Bacteroidia bacterium]|nr:TCR/Tet family MFS transporter [Bacteroidia bacterium]
MAGRQPALGFIFVTLLIDITGLGIIIPVMPKLIMHLSDVSLSKAASIGGWLVFAYAIMQFLASPVIGGLSDRYGRRPVLLASLFGFGIDYLLLAVAPTLGWLFVGRIIAGITGASFTTATAYIADISTPEKRAQNFGIVGAAFGLGFIIGPVFGGFLGQYGPRIPFFAAAILTLINWLYGYFILPESLSVDHRRKFDWKRANPVGTLKSLTRYPLISGLVTSLVLIYIAAHAVQSTWAFFTMEKFGWSEAMVGYSLGFAGLMVAIVQGMLIRKINPKLGPKRSVTVGILTYAVGLSLFAMASKGWMMFAILVPYCLGGIAGPALQGIMANQVPPNEQGELQGGLTSLISVTSIVGPLLMTNLFAVFTSPKAPVYFPGIPFAAGALLCLFSAYFAMKALNKNNHA